MTLRKAAAARVALFYCDGGFGNENHSEGRERPLRAETTAASIKDDAGQDSAGFKGSSAKNRSRNTTALYPVPAELESAARTLL